VPIQIGILKLKNNASRVVEKVFGSKNLPFYLMLFIFLVFSPLLNSDLILDDYVQKVMISGSSSIGDVDPPSNIYKYLCIVLSYLY